ncbi:MFS transporter [Amycolatopsis rubida]|uniref:MFS transporter n=1 Tax=Amycolatopsis rubida TaxID=112413 RepID=A0ABX0C3V2_9PSEU|nr:MFS transporter [Amycolatopsis sp. M39]MYW96989.1 MFS transporter [Amycolatopsis rubida]NEC61974.1 MFS transporter [Amycolatopsis rubida]OAP21489.1 putative multidrug-efflux transporter [Amycolatopsis sp. M39]
MGSWRELGAHFSTAAVLAGGVLVGAVNIYVAASLLPTAVADIGGERLYAWNMTAFLVAQVVATMFVSRALARLGNAAAYYLGFGVFAAGSVVCAVSPAMPVLLAGRGVQGLGAGLLTGLGFAVIHSALPRHLWTRGSALISAMFGVGNLVGPALGGLFAQFGSWRAAFVVLAGAAVVIAALVPRALPRSARSGEPTPVPTFALVAVVGAVGAVSIAGILANVVAMAACIVLGFGFVAAFLLVEKRAAVRVLPAEAYEPGSPLRWIYLTIMCLAAGVSVEAFLPLFGQHLGGLPPAAAGFFSAALSFGWSAGQIVNSSARRVRLLCLAGPTLLAAAFVVLALLQKENASVLAWLVVLLAGGTGIGIAMPHLSVAAMASGQQAAAAIATVLTMATAFGASIAGLLVNLGAPSMVTSARYLLIGFAVVAAAGIFTTAAAGVGARQAAARTDLPPSPRDRAPSGSSTDPE